MSQKSTGQVKWFNEKKGFGFIVDTSGKDIFVHYKDITSAGFRTLHVNDHVEFLVNDGPKGCRAHEVIVIKRDILEELECNQ